MDTLMGNMLWISSWIVLGLGVSFLLRIRDFDKIKKDIKGFITSSVLGSLSGGFLASYLFSVLT